MSRLRWVALSLLALGACKTHLLDEPPPDGAVRCVGSHYPAPTPLDRLSLVDPAGSLARGRALRILVGVPVREGCEHAGEVAVRREEGDPQVDAFTLSATVWRPREGGVPCGPPAIVDRVIVLSDDPAGLTRERVVISDANGGTARREIELPVAPGGCTATAMGEGCSRDCQCQAGGLPQARCVPNAVGGSVCDVPCAEDADCASSGIAACRGKPTYLCGGGGCLVDVDCPFGQRCMTTAMGRGCRPAQETEIDAPCACATDCGFGGLCKWTVDLAWCQIPCATTAGCPTGMRCVSSECVPSG